MADQYHRDRSGRILGVQCDLPSGSQQMRDPSGKILGHYDKATNQTTNAAGAIIGIGNLLLKVLAAFKK